MPFLMGGGGGGYPISIPSYFHWSLSLPKEGIPQPGQMGRGYLSQARMGYLPPQVSQDRDGVPPPPGQDGVTPPPPPAGQAMVSTCCGGYASFGFQQNFLVYLCKFIIYLFTDRIIYLCTCYVHSSCVEPVLHLVCVVDLQNVIPTKLHIICLLGVLKEIHWERNLPCWPT